MLQAILVGASGLAGTATYSDQRDDVTTTAGRWLWDFGRWLSDFGRAFNPLWHGQIEAIHLRFLAWLLVATIGGVAALCLGAWLDKNTNGRPKSAPLWTWVGVSFAGAVATSLPWESWLGAGIAAWLASEIALVLLCAVAFGVVRRALAPHEPPKALFLIPLALIVAAGAVTAIPGFRSVDVRWVTESDNWKAMLFGLQVALTLGGAGLFILERVLAKRGTPAPRRVMMGLWITMAALAFGSYYGFGNPNVRYDQYYHRHEFFHYYLGAKYTKALGYERLYECAAVAEMDNGRAEDVRGRDIRDLRENRIKPIGKTQVLTEPDALCRDRFGERWDEFRSDVAWFERSSRGDYWRNMWKDHGYNPPPVWTMGGKFFSDLAPASHEFFLALSMVDIWLQLGAVLLLYWAFGWRVGSIAAVFWGCNAPADFYWTGGAFLRQDWYFMLVASVALAKKRYFFLSGAALTWSALLRAFPIVLFAGWGLMVLFHLLRRGKIERTHARMIAGCVVAGLALGGASLAVSGTDSYGTFKEHISVHKSTPLTNQMGLETVLAHTWSGRMAFARDDSLDDPFDDWKDLRKERAEHLKWLQFGIVGLLFAWLAWCLRRTKSLWIAVPLSLPFIPAMLNLTCYYYSAFIVAAALVAVVPALAPALLITSAATQIMHKSFGWYDDRFAAESWLFLLLSVILLFAYSRPISFERLKRWLAGLPELPTSRERAAGRAPNAPSE